MVRHERRGGGRNRVMRLARLLVLGAAGCLVFPTAASAQADTSVPLIWADLATDSLGGSGFTPDSYVSLRVYDGPGGSLLYGRDDRPTDGEGSFGTPDSPVDVGEEAGVDLIAGMQVQVTDQATAAVKTLTLADLTFDQLDPATDTASGRAPAAAALTGLVGSTGNACTGDPVPETSFSTTAAATGAWSVHLTTDLLAIARGVVQTLDTDGDATRASFVPSEPLQFQAFLRSDEISAEGGWDPDSAVEVSVRAADGSLRYTGTASTDAVGGFVLPYAQHGINLSPGLRITISDSNHTLPATLTAISWDHLDPVTGIGSGTIPPGTVPCVGGEIHISDQQTGKGLWPIDIDADGRWSAPFGPGITADSWGHIGLGGTTVATYLPPRRGIADLRATVTTLAGQRALTRAQATTLSRLLARTAHHLDRGHPRAATAALRTFGHLAATWAATGRLAPDRAGKLTDDAGAVITAIDAR